MSEGVCEWTLIGRKPGDVVFLVRFYWISRFSPAIRGLLLGVKLKLRNVCVCVCACAYSCVV